MRIGSIYNKQVHAWIECDCLSATDFKRTVQLDLLTTSIILADFNKMSGLTNNNLNETNNLAK
jgi:hypothetical protein